MLQNHRKGTDFSPNNQKKTQKKSQDDAKFSAPIAGRSPIFIFSSRRSVENMASHLDVSNIVKL